MGVGRRRSRGSGGARSGGRSLGCSVEDGYVLVVAEKPKAAAKIAVALGGGRRCRHRSGAPFWVVYWRGGVYVVGSAAGHLFGLDSLEDGFPVFRYAWRPLWLVERGAGYVRPFYEALRDLARGASLFVNACDFDIEGSVIGFMVIKWFGDVRRAKRAKFSSLTPGELRRAFERLEPLDWEMIEAGLARHELDWLWGVNVSRALMHSYRAATGRRRILSAGRVQSPTLVEAFRRDYERRLHLPLPIFVVEATVSKGEWRRSVRVGVFETVAEARRVADTLRETRRGVVERVERARKIVPRPYPFNLGDLQSEAARVFGFSPYYTQKLAEDLYLEGLISYPRTNSQRLPRDLDLKGILAGLAGQRAYAGLIEVLASRGRLVPRNGPKEDPAHPAIYPTGERPDPGLGRAHLKLYDLIVRRFLATLSWDAVVEKVRAIVKVAGAVTLYIDGERLVDEGWMAFYSPYVEPPRREVPPLRRGDTVSVGAAVRREYTRPPELYTRAGLVKWMERVGIGTEATRARIVELLFQRGYLESRSGRVRVTRLGEAVVNVLSRFFAELTSVELTRRFERLLEDIRSGRATRGAVIEEAKRLLSERLTVFKERYMVDAGRLLAYYLGDMQAPRSCRVCGLPAAGEDSEAGPLCPLHLAAVRRVREGYREWSRRLGGEIGYREYLRRLASSRQAGCAVREAATLLLSAGATR